MKVIIMGCGRVGARLATIMDSEGHMVSVIDKTPEAFTRLPQTYQGTTHLGDATDEDVQREAGASGSDVFVAVTQGDNRNLMAAQIAKHIFGIGKVICRIYDPLRQEIFSQRGLLTFSPTTVLTRLIHETIEE